MSDQKGKGVTRIDRLADTLRKDIQRRALRSGDHYLTAAEAGQMLGVTSIMANRAMNVLAERSLLIRHRRRGTFVGPAFDPPAPTQMVAVHFIDFMDDDPNWNAPMRQMLAGLQENIANVRLSYHQMPYENAVHHVREVVERISSSPSFGGIILAFGPRGVQQYLSDTGLPVVVHGSVYPGIDIPFLDVDQKAVGRLMAKIGIDKGSSRLVFVNREHWRQGDTLTFDGIMEKVHAAGLGQGAIRIRNMPIDPKPLEEVAFALIRELQGEPNGRTAVLCRSPQMANAVDRAARTCGLSVPEQILIVCNVAPFGTPLGVACPTVSNHKTAEDEYAILGAMLKQLNQEGTERPQSVLMPVSVGYSQN